MKNIQIIDSAENCVYDIFQATAEEFDLIFGQGQDIAFIDDVLAQHPKERLDQVFQDIWQRRIPKKLANGIHGILFYQLHHKKIYYPTLVDEEATNPDGRKLR